MALSKDILLPDSTFYRYLKLVCLVVSTTLVSTIAVQAQELVNYIACTTLGELLVAITL